ncbi:MAG: FAD-dependent oxidoreductase [Planctomycetota bacterium]|nr:FAD-dependent oxidoreductase [Planctomycetota bacterium]
MTHTQTIVIIGGGHAGAEAARAASSALLSRSGARVLLVTLDPSRIGAMSCNPANGGLGKGQLVREVDALGGVMGRATDATGIMFKVLNTSKGPAVRGPRVQCDRYAYAAEVQRLVSQMQGVEVVCGEVIRLEVENGVIRGVVLASGAGIVEPDSSAIENALDPLAAPRAIFGNKPTRSIDTACAVKDGLFVPCTACVLTTGTFMAGLMHTGPVTTPGGRVGEGAAGGMSRALRELGFELGRLKTGTPPRLFAPSVDFAGLDAQYSDVPPLWMSDLTTGSTPRLRQVACHITHTTNEAHEVIRANLHRAPMYSGQIDAKCGPRYCPSIEDKIVRFADRPSHQVFLEPEGLHTDELYCNGISTSLPPDVQEIIVHAMAGCEKARILRYGYAVEYDMVWPHQIAATCETHLVQGLFLAGQINGTTGYEEAAGQGILAGLNAARRTVGEQPITFGRDEAYIGVMMDDLVTKTPREPYRMFTSRAEHRLHLRADNADERLTPRGKTFGLVDDTRWNLWESRRESLARLGALMVGGARVQALHMDVSPRAFALEYCPDEELKLVERAITAVRYEPYVQRQRSEVRRMADQERAQIPAWLDPKSVRGLRNEAVEVLHRHRPATFGQASRLSGINPVDLTLLTVAIERQKAIRATDSDMGQ